MDHVCSVDGCYERGKYLSDKADWFCEEHKPEKLFKYMYEDIKENKDEEIITNVKIKHNTCYKSRKEAEKILREFLIADGYNVGD